MAYTEQLAAGLELFQGMERKNRDEPMEIGSSHQDKKPIEQLVQMAESLNKIMSQSNQMVSKVAKLEAQVNSQKSRQDGGRFHNRQEQRQSNFSKNKTWF